MRMPEDKKPLISAIMGVRYRRESLDLLRRAVESVLNQTVTDFEFLICDGGSSPEAGSLLDSYAEFESAGVEGENLRQAKLRIESTMDKIIRGFERQLDELYKADAMDVDSDIRVMETMLRRDTASVEDDFGITHTEQ